MSLVESILLSTVCIYTFNQQQKLTNATGFFFRRADRLFLVTCRHVMVDEASDHYPDRIEIVLHNAPKNLATASVFSILLYENGSSSWRQGVDSAGEVDVAVLEIEQDKLPSGTVFSAFTPEHLPDPQVPVAVGTSVMVVGFPLGFQDTLHNIPIARQGMIASSYGLRFQGEGFFLTDARTHRGISGAPVVMRQTQTGPDGELPYTLLGIHSARLDVGTRDLELDEVLGLNCSWYADILLALTE